MSNVKTKLKKNYLALAIVIAVLGVISAALFTVSSFATTVNNDKIHFTGKALDPYNEAVSSGRVYVQVYELISDESGEHFRQVDYDGITSSTGEFDIEISIAQDAIYSQIHEYGVQRDGTSLQRRLWYYNYPSTIILDSNIDVGSFVCPYFVKLDTLINNVDYYSMKDYGTWYWNDSPMALESNGGGPGYFYYNASYAVNNNVVVINSDETSVQPAREDTFRFEVNTGHKFLGMNVEQEVGTNASTLITGGTLNVNAVVDNPGPVPPTPTLYTVTFGENIYKVLANGVEIASGTEVEEGTNLQIIPAVADKKVTKVYVNDYVCSTCQTTVNSDIDIEGQMFDSVKLSGMVLTGEQQPDAFQAVSKLFVDKAYAAESVVEGAVVTFTDATDGWNTSTVSDPNGEFELDVVRGNAGMLTVSKDGYETYTKEIDGVDLEDDYVINPVLKEININPENANSSTSSSPQTGDGVTLAIFMMVIVASAIVLFSSNRRNPYKHSK